MPLEHQRLALTMPLAFDSASITGEDQVFRATVIRAGVFTPGLGNPDGLRVHFSKEFLAENYQDLEGQKVDLEHLQDIENEVGFMRDVRFDGERVTADLVIQSDRPRFADAVGFINGRKESGLVPNVSVELENVEFVEAPEGETEWDLSLTKATFTGVAILTKGACSDSDGCGIGLSHYKSSAEGADTDADKASVTVLALTDSDGDSQTKGEPMPNENESGGPCQCQDGKDTDTTALKAELASAKSALEAMQAEAATLREQVMAYADAEREATLEAVTAAAPEGTDLKEVLGVEPTEADLRTLEVALSAFRASGLNKVGLSGGRHTATGKRDRNDLGSGEDHLARMRKRLGFEGKAPVLPKTFRTNSPHLFKEATE